ncbi:MAG: hypothetical protein KA112_00900 [Alphaproteobacteria bacterium]|jgi:hypothetical protein|nr:hypothetical protein [Alphaproteobacteria bacterium]MBP7729160.1 hypothetical protein [Alphaproteobacteria bacterium]
MSGVRDAIINSLEEGALFQSGFVVINEDIIAWVNDTINALTLGGVAAASSDPTL